MINVGEGGRDVRSQKLFFFTLCQKQMEHQIGFKGNIFPFIPIRSIKLSTGYQILFQAGENRNIDQGVQFIVAIGYKHKRSYSEGVTIYSD